MSNCDDAENTVSVDLLLVLAVVDHLGARAHLLQLALVRFGTVHARLVAVASEKQVDGSAVPFVSVDTMYKTY